MGVSLTVSWTRTASAEYVTAELANAERMDHFFGKDGIFAKIFANTLEQMMEVELTDRMGCVLGRWMGVARMELTTG